VCLSIASYFSVDVLVVLVIDNFCN
jgi:hypothetical protein